MFTTTPAPTKSHTWIWVLIVILAIGIKVFAFPNAAIKLQHIVGTSMEPTLHNNEWVLQETFSYQVHNPQRGDLIAFYAPPEPTAMYEKRIIGVPGDAIDVDDTTVYVNGIRLSEPYVTPELQGNPNSNKYIHTIVPAGCYFVMGDDRLWSYDSRAWGFVPKHNIVYHTILVTTPFADNTGLIP